MALISLKFKKVLIDLGYNLFFCQGESVKLKNSWTDKVYGLAHIDFPINIGAFVINAADTLYGKAINKTDLNLAGATTPSQLTHKPFVSIGVCFNISQVPSILSGGFSYEIAGSNNELEGYALWLKLGLSF